MTTDIAITPAPKHTSYSAITTFTSCGEQYRLSKVAKAPEVPAWWSWGGTAVHAVTEAWDLDNYLADLTGDDMPPGWDQAGIEARFAVALEKAKTERESAPYPARSSKNQGEEWWLANGPIQVAGYIEWRQATGWQLLTTDAGAPAIELKVTAEIGGLPILAYIDRVFVTPDGEPIIVDLKSGAREPGDPLQLGTYRVLVAETLGITCDLGAYFMTRKGTLTVPKHLGMYDKEYLARIVEPFSKARETEAYVANPTSMMCGYCGVAYACFAKGGPAADRFR